MGVSLTFQKLSKTFPSKFVYSKNQTSYENFKLGLCPFAQSHALGTRTKFQLEILTIDVIFVIAYFSEIILESSRIVSETTPRITTVKALASIFALSATDILLAIKDINHLGHYGVDE